MESTVFEPNAQIGQPPRRYRTDHSHDWDFAYGAVTGLLAGAIITAWLLAGRPSTQPPEAVKTPPTAIPTAQVVEVDRTAPQITMPSDDFIASSSAVNPNAIEVSSTETVPEIHTQTFTATAYCSCEKCCRVWATKRGPGPVVGAAGVPLIPGTSVAIDSSVYSFGTKFIDRDGHEYIAADTGLGVKGNHIDIYFSDHQEALQWGVQYLELEVQQG